MVMGRCEIHCPGGGAGVAAAAVAVAAGVALAVALAAAGAVIVAAVAVADLALVAWLAAMLRAGPRTYRPAAVVKAPARVAVEAATAPLAIEASKPVVYRITDLRESSVRGQR